MKKINKKILVTGGTGLIGYHFVKLLLKKNYKVINLDKKKSDLNHRNYQYYNSNLSNINTIKKHLKDIDTVYHFAGFSDLTDSKYFPLETIKDNIEKTVLLLKASEDMNVKKFIFASSIYASSSQGSFYACSKRAAEDYIVEFCNSKKIDFVILRFGTIFGENSKLNNGVKKIIYDALKYKKVIYSGTQNAEREYIDVLDAAEGCFQCNRKNFRNKILKITGEKKIKISNLINYLKKRIKIKSVKFLNEKKTDHYDKSPIKYQLKRDKSLKLDKYRSFNLSIDNLIIETKKEIEGKKI